MKQTFATLASLLLGLAFVIGNCTAAEKPVLLYSQYFNAPGENRYPADGDFSEVIGALRNDFMVRTNSDVLTTKTLADVKVLLIANPNDQPHGTNPPPHHIAGQDAITLYNWIVGGGALILMGNQDGHNLETTDVNKFLGLIGMKWADHYTDAKKLVLPDDAPIIGGLNWAYYTGNQIEITPGHPAQPRALVMNDLDQKPEKGTRDEAGCLLAIAEPGNGRVVLVTDSGWIANWALDDRGIGGVAIKDEDNLRIMLRLTRWAAHLPTE
ncbi:hypothetical protein GC207_00905 [bacterium]|nr:hypothetical protein [bacterium]